MSEWLNPVVFGAGLAVALVLVIKELLFQEQPQHQQPQPPPNINRNGTQFRVPRNRRYPCHRKCQVCSIEFAESEFISLLPCLHKECCRDCGVRLQKCITCKGQIADRVTQGGEYLPFVPPSEEDDSTCHICYDNEKTKKLTCGHFLCNTCFVKVKECPFCRRSITLSPPVST